MLTTHKKSVDYKFFVQLQFVYFSARQCILHLSLEVYLKTTFLSNCYPLENNQKVIHQCQEECFSALQNVDLAFISLPDVLAMTR